MASGGHSSSRCAGLSLSRPLLLRSTGSRRAGSVIVAHGLVALRHVGSSRTRARTRVPCIGRRILNHCATREAPSLLLQLQHQTSSPGTVMKEFIQKNTVQTGSVYKFLLLLVNINNATSLPVPATEPLYSLGLVDKLINILNHIITPAF